MRDIIDSTATIALDQFFPYSPARVWRALTDPDLLGRWLMPNDFQLKVGHRFTFKGTPMPRVQDRGQGQLCWRDRRLTATTRLVHLSQLLLKCLIKEKMSMLAQKHKELRFLDSFDNLFLFD